MNRPIGPPPDASPAKWKREDIIVFRELAGEA
jgi:hypothetical protein